MASYDMPALINYALKVSGAANLSYIGHSEVPTKDLFLLLRILLFRGLFKPLLASKTPLRQAM